MFDDLVTDTGGTRGAAAVDAWARVENAACARRLAAMVTMLDDARAASGSAERDQWCIDNWDAVTAHIGAVQRTTSGVASNLLLVGVALRERLPKVLALFMDGLIDYRMVKAIVTRTANVIDPAAQHALDAELAMALRRWGPMSVDKTEHAIDDLVEKHDPHARRRTQTRARSRSLDVVIEDGSGMATVFGTLFATDAVAFDKRVDALAETVCPNDPRTKDERRSDALGVLGHADRLACLCGSEACIAALNPPASGTVIYIVAHHETVNGSAENPPTASGPNDSEPDGPSKLEPEPHEPDVSAPDDPGDPDMSNSVDNSFEPDPPAPPTKDAAEAPFAAPEPAGPSEPEPDQFRRVGAPGPEPEDPTADECTGLDGVEPPMFTKPLSELTLTEALASPPGKFATIRPAAMMGGQFLPGAVTRRASLNATLVKIVHPGQATPELHYRPSKKLADFVRCRDLICRFPGCKQPATNCDVDHTVPWPYGRRRHPTSRRLCRKHHLLKTFWAGEGGWRDRQLPDGTVEWSAPDGGEHITTPGSWQLFPELCLPTAPAEAKDVPPTHASGLAMPHRKTTRAQDRLDRTLYERELNRLEPGALPPPY